MTRLIAQKISHLNSLVLRQEEGHDFFIAADNSIIISIPTLSYIISFLTKAGYIDKEILCGILEEVNTSENREDKLYDEKGVKDWSIKKS
jgi:hypothetical protein